LKELAILSKHPAIRSAAVLVACLLPLGSWAAEGAPDFGREVRPILAKHCFTCHGPDGDARQAELRLDREESAKQDRGGYAAIKAGDAAGSELIVRVSSADADQRMPPADSHPPLSATEIETLRRWIDAGGAYDLHWAFVAPTKPPVPEVVDGGWSAGPIDRFISEKLQLAQLQPAEPAQRSALLRRVYLHLTGTTPSVEEVERFVHDTDPQAYRKVVDRLLASTDYAERFARPWLDLARYSDTNGYEKDRPRIMWPYREWVIRALAADMPYDQFSIEQLAGDMLPNATNEQLIATGFHRNTMLNEEGGIDPLEYRFYALVDRVATTGTTWLGLTIGCAQCHTHKYDPITHTDYYSLLALLNNADEPDVIVADPVRSQQVLDVERRIEQIEAELIASQLPDFQSFGGGQVAEDPISKAFVTWLNQQLTSLQRWQRLRPTVTDSTMPKLTILEDDSILASGDATKRDVYRLKFQLPAGRNSALRLEVLPHDSLPAGGPGLAFYEGRRGDFFLSELAVKLNEQPLQLKDASHSYGKINIGSGSADAANVLDGDGSTGWSTSDNEGKANQLVVNFASPVEGPGELAIELIFERHYAAALGRFRFAVANAETAVVASVLPLELQDAFANESFPNEADFRQFQRHFVRTADEFKNQRKPIDELLAAIPEDVRTLGMRERTVEDARVTHRHHRGEYLQPREAVTAGVPSMFPPITDVAANRLSLAKWLVSESNPLVARVIVNSAWREFFGTGIVDTAGDFGTQSEPPSHPELLDWLACDFRQQGWSLKKLHRQIVLSATYQQSIGAAPKADPQNRLLSRFPHRRLDAESIRDTFLSAAGLLTRQVGGPSVYPPQPESIMQMAYASPAWETSQGANRYRRSIYTFSKRTAPFAAFTTFDGPTGELCIARRDQSTTPLQALTLLNDAMYVEIASALAEQTLRDVGANAAPEIIASHMFRRLLTRSPQPSELDAIVKFYQSQQEQAQPWALVARALINTDEAITVP
jgi:Protein of unknown function (DUF1553)/Protein of unknown function (DUF1549)/Planctomycete cytochrome C